MAAPTFIAKSTETFHSATSMDQPYMGSILSTDILFLYVWSYHAAGGAGTADINTPGGWTLLGGGNYEDSGGNPHGDFKVFYKKAIGGESGNVTITRVGGDAMHSQMVQYRGTNNAIESVANKHDGNGSATITWDAISVGGGERTLLAFYSNNSSNGGSPVDLASGYTSDAYDFGGVTVAHGLGVFSNENVSSDGAVTSSDGAVGGWVTVHVSLFNSAGGFQIPDH